MIVLVSAAEVFVVLGGGFLSEPMATDQWVLIHV